MSKQLQMIDEIFHSDTVEKFQKIEPTNQYLQFSIHSCIPKKTKFITKRKYKENSKWTSQEQIKYLKKIIIDSVQRPYVHLSWKTWKPQGFFPNMSKYISTKDAKQCKSYDQRQKQNSLSTHNLDVLQFAEKQISKYQKMDDDITIILKKLSQMKKAQSKHMDLLSKKKLKFQSINSKILQLKLNLQF